jgi:hypothetical protein
VRESGEAYILRGFLKDTYFRSAGAQTTHWGICIFRQIKFLDTTRAGDEVGEIFSLTFSKDVSRGQKNPLLPRKPPLPHICVPFACRWHCLTCTYIVKIAVYCSVCC